MKIKPNLSDGKKMILTSKERINNLWQKMAKIEKILKFF
ncbi:unnamed protein product [Paramecium sonneborni]|uniref:Uncharacterized protein n=1 Tax=Paramecium sonneborni TaxID=65129 RepID=A0A8S1Q1F2_9CILI|nr:unnamed protein product [Paramecium sonneborni]